MCSIGFPFVQILIHSHFNIFTVCYYYSLLWLIILISLLLQPQLWPLLFVLAVPSIFPLISVLLLFFCFCFIMYPQCACSSLMIDYCTFLPSLLLFSDTLCPIICWTSLTVSGFLNCFVVSFIVWVSPLLPAGNLKTLQRLSLGLGDMAKKIITITFFM